MVIRPLFIPTVCPFSRAEVARPGPDSLSVQSIKYLSSQSTSWSP